MRSNEDDRESKTTKQNNNTTMNHKQKSRKPKQKHNQQHNEERINGEVKQMRKLTGGSISLLTDSLIFGMMKLPFLRPRNKWTSGRRRTSTAGTRQKPTSCSNC